MDAKHSLTRKWIMKARRDLLSAKKLARGKDPYLDTAIYHCQQTAEKAIKGWLVCHDVSFEKTFTCAVESLAAHQEGSDLDYWLSASFEYFS